MDGTKLFANFFTVLRFTSISNIESQACLKEWEKYKKVFNSNDHKKNFKLETNRKNKILRFGKIFPPWQDILRCPGFLSIL